MSFLLYNPHIYYLTLLSKPFMDDKIKHGDSEKMAMVTSAFKWLEIWKQANTKLGTGSLMACVDFLTTQFSFCAHQSGLHYSETLLGTQCLAIFPDLDCFEGLPKFTQLLTSSVLKLLLSVYGSTVFSWYCLDWVKYKNKQTKKPLSFVYSSTPFKLFLFLLCCVLIQSLSPPSLPKF